MKTIQLAGPGGLVLALILAGGALAGPYHTENIPHPTFGQLDIDADGVLSKAEAAGARGLLDQWTDADRDANDAIDRSEFAAFESLDPMQSPQPRDWGTGLAPGTP